MALPKAVQDQLDEAERLQSEFVTAQAGEPETRDAQAEPVEAEPEVETQEPETKPEPVVTEETWEQRYKSYTGHYEAEMARAREAAQQAEERTRRLEAEMAELKNQFTQKQQQTVSSLVTDDDVEAFGNDLIDLQKRVAKQTYLEAKQEFAQERKQLEAEIAALRGEVTGVNERVAGSDYDRFLNKVTQVVPDWEQINANQGFLRWLGEVDPMLGKPRQALMDEAAGAMDANRVSAIFTAYKTLVSKPTSKPSTDLQRQVSPSKTASSATSVEPTNTTVWSQRDIQRFYQDVAQGHISAERAVQIEAELNAAVAEGRVV